MADNYAPPSGPPPPKVPAGYKAVWNDQYKEWFYVNIYTKKSQWDKPTEPVYGPSVDGAPDGPPPGYNQSDARRTSPEKGGVAQPSTDDEALARRLQAEENARVGGSADRGASDSYYNQGGPGASRPQGSNYYGPGPGGAGGPSGPPLGPAYGQTASPVSPAGTDGQKRGFFSKIMGGGRPQQPAYPPQQGYGQQYPPQGYGGGPGYGPPQPGYYAPQAGYQQPPPKRSGLGAGGGALLGAGAGLVGGALLMDAIEDHDQNEYDQGYMNGMNADDGGGDYGGDGGDYGGDGGDFGGGDF